MPIIKIYSPDKCPSPDVLSSLCKKVTQVLQLPADHAWAFWHRLTELEFHRPDWTVSDKPAAPMVMMYCKSTYSEEQIEHVIWVIRNHLADTCRCSENEIYISCLRILPNHLLVRGDIWRG
ncbi:MULTISPECIES: hypothetical protein [Geobacillus]|uniref:hypothetical protein n=1 Tax=Geobacillus TaxID=129337 RepID=UPI0011A66EDF|nr:MULTISPECIES: hypothetical protein [Geobacillus]